MAPDPSPLRFAIVAAAFLAFWLVVLAVSHLVTRDKETKTRSKPIKRVTLTRSEPPLFRFAPLHHDCSHCVATFTDPPNESLQYCPRCGLPFARSYSVTESVPTPEEPPTLPTGKDAA